MSRLRVCPYCGSVLEFEGERDVMYCETCLRYIDIDEVDLPP